MKPKYILIFDLDDTIQDTSDLYWRVRQEFISLLIQDGFGDKDLEKIFEHFDSVNTLRYGYAPIRYEITMLEMYEMLNGFLPKDKIQEIKRIAKKIVSEIPKLIEGALELLDWTSTRFNLVLVTRGEPKVQLEKIKKHRLKRYFNTNIKVVPKKDENLYLQIIAAEGYKTREAIIIGDSLKAEINPALRIGAIAIHYLYTHHSYIWLQEHTERPVEGDYFQITHLLQAKDILSKFV